MGADLQTFIQRLELLGFFAGYPLLYALVSVISGYRSGASGGGGDRAKLPALLPTAYASVGALFLFYLLWQAARSGSFGILALRAWGIGAILFWLPRWRKFPVYSLLHSLVFFGLMVSDMVTGFSTLSGRDQVANDIRVISLGFVLNATVFALILLVVFIRRTIRQRPGI